MPKENSIERIRYTFKVPPSAKEFPDDPTTITLVPITAREESDASQVANDAKIPLGTELLRRSVVEIDGKPVRWDDGSDGWIERCGPKVRTLAYEAFSKVNVPPKEDAAAFLASMTVVA